MSTHLTLLCADGAEPWRDSPDCTHPDSEEMDVVRGQPRCLSETEWRRRPIRSVAAHRAHRCKFELAILNACQGPTITAKDMSLLGADVQG